MAGEDSGYSGHSGLCPALWPPSLGSSSTGERTGTQCPCHHDCPKGLALCPLVGAHCGGCRELQAGMECPVPREQAGSSADTCRPHTGTHWQSQGPSDYSYVSTSCSERRGLHGDLCSGLPPHSRSSNWVLLCSAGTSGTGAVRRAAPSHSTGAAEPALGSAPASAAAGTPPAGTKALNAELGAAGSNVG